MGSEGTGGGAGQTGGTGTAGAGAGGEQAGQVADALSAWTPTSAAGDKTGNEPQKDADKTKVADKDEGKGSESTPDVDDKSKGKEGEGDKPAENVEIASLKATVNTLQKTLESLLQGGSKPEKKVEPVKSTSYVASQEEVDKALESHESLNALLSKVKDDARKETLATLPAIIDNVVRTQFTLRSKVSDFYKDNKDLTPHKEFVGHVVNDLMGKNPDWDLDKVFGELPKEVRKRIGLKQQVDSKGGKNPPAPRGGRGARLPAEHPTEAGILQEEIADLITE